MKRYLIPTVIVLMVMLFNSNVHAAEDLEVNISTMNTKSANPLSGVFDEYNFNYKDANPVHAGIVGMENLFDNDLQTAAKFKLHSEIAIELEEPVNIRAFFIATELNKHIIVNFYDDNNKLVSDIGMIRGNPNGTVVDFNKDIKVAKIAYYHLNETIEIYEFELYENLVYAPVANVTHESTETEITLKWKNPTSLRMQRIEVNGVDVGLNQEYVDKNLEPNKTYEYNIKAIYKDGTEMNYIYNAKTKAPPIDIVPPGNVTELTAKQQNNDVKLTYVFPKDDDFLGVNIYRDGLLIKENHKEQQYIDPGLPLNRSYLYKVVSVDTSGNKSPGEVVSVIVSGTDVTNLKGFARFYDEVELNWVNPKSNDFKNVKIYRKKKNDFNVFAFMKSVFSNNDGYETLFETNGTIFKDFTVNPDTEYVYKVTSNIADNESEGVTVEVKTPKTSVSGGGTTTDENGDYLIKWDKPTTGKIKVVVGGKEYKIVPASDKQIIIPKDEMKFDLLGKPDVQLIPIDEDGNEGLPTKPGGGGTGDGGIGDIVGGGTASDILNADNVLKAAVSLLGVIGAFVLLGLAFRVVPKLIQTIRTALGARNKKDNVLPGTGRRT